MTPHLTRAQSTSLLRALFGRLLVLVLSAASAGCYSSWDIVPSSLSALHGYHYPEVEPRMVVDVEGNSVPFETGSQLQFPPMSKPEKFGAIQVSGATFTGTTYPDGLQVSADLRQLSMVHMRKFSLWKTTLAIGIPVVILTVTGVILDAVLGANQTADDGSPLTTAPPHRRR